MNSDALLLGRVTYQGFAQAWPSMGTDEFGQRMNSIPKYVVSSTLTDAEATWGPTTVIRGDVVAEIARLKDQPGGDLLAEGSGQLAQTLIRRGLVDEYRLMLFPIVLGAEAPVPRRDERVGPAHADRGQAGPRRCHAAPVRPGRKEADDEAVPVQRVPGRRRRPAPGPRGDAAGLRRRGGVRRRGPGAPALGLRGGLRRRAPPPWSRRQAATRSSPTARSPRARSMSAGSG